MLRTPFRSPKSSSKKPRTACQNASNGPTARVPNAHPKHASSRSATRIEQLRFMERPLPSRDTVQGLSQHWISQHAMDVARIKEAGWWAYATVLGTIRKPYNTDGHQWKRTPSGLLDLQMQQQTPPLMNRFSRAQSDIDHIFSAPLLANQPSKSSHRTPLQPSTLLRGIQSNPRPQHNQRKPGILISQPHRQQRFPHKSQTPPERSQLPKTGSIHRHLNMIRTSKLCWRDRCAERKYRRMISVVPSTGPSLRENGYQSPSRRESSHLVGGRQGQQEENDKRHKRKKTIPIVIVRFGAQWRDDLQALRIRALANWLPYLRKS